MAGPDWLRWLITAVFVAVAGYGVARLVAAGGSPVPYRSGHRVVDLAHVVMAAGMAVMSSPVGGPLPMAAWRTVFLMFAAWFAVRALRDRRGCRDALGWHGGGIDHAVAGFAMLYMLTAVPHQMTSMPWTGPHHGSGPVAFPVLGWLFVGYFLAHAIGLGVTMLSRNRRTAELPTAPPILRSSRVTAGCQLAMTLGATYMLVGIL